MTQIGWSNKAYLFIALNLNLSPPEHLFDNTGLSLCDMKNLDHISIDDAIQFVHNLKKYSYTPNFAALFGAHLGAASHGPVGYATLSAPTVGKALTTFSEWFQIRSEVYTAKVIETKNFFEIIISDTTGDPIFKEFFFEAFMRAFEVIMACLIGRSSKKEIQLCFQTQAENRQSLMKEEYDSTLIFGASENKITIPKNIWTVASPLYDKDLYELNLRKCQQIMEQRKLEDRIDLKIKHLIQKHFDQCATSKNAVSPVTQKQMCKLVFMSERTLIRHLKGLNTSYKKILEEERQYYAHKLLEQERYTVYDIADILGYTESANFCRAFKRWRGLSPSEYRRRSAG
ncbi:MAG: AraC-like DNA-binding protein [Colwellia sp.]|jgi:AraC-like DNA-binding protein